MNHLIKRGQLRRAASKTLSITLSATTSLWLVGSSVVMTLPVAQAANNEVSVTDVTGTNPRIAANGESERVFLGLNMTRTDTTATVQLNGVRVRLTSDDTNTESAQANIETVRLYTDSSLSGTNGVFDNNDALLASVSRTEAGATSVALAPQTAVTAVTTKDATGGEDTPTTQVCLTNANAAGFAAGDAISVLDASGPTTFYRIVTAKTAVTNAAAAGSSCVAAAGAVATDTLLTVDTAMAGRTAADGDTVTGLANYPAGITAILLTDVAANIADTDFVKIGSLANTTEIRDLGTQTPNLDGTGDLFLIAGGTAYTHAAAEVVREVTNPVAADAANGFNAYGTPATTTIVDVGDPGGDGSLAVTEDLGYDIAKTDSGTDQGDDAFIVLLTAGGLANQTLKAQVFTSGDVDYMDSVTPSITTPSLATGSGTTNGQTKSVTFGTDSVAPTMSKIESFDTNNDGIVDRFKAYFNEQMANTVTASDNFKDANGGTANRINALDVSTTDLALGTITWLTTTVLNDTAQFDVTNTGAYTSRAQSTGDVWTVVYDADAGNDLTDATGTLLADASITTTDKARPYLVSAELKDNDSDSKVDELDVLFSESLGGASTASGFTLTNTTVSGSPTYTMGSVLGFKTSTAAGFNNNDTIRIALTEFASADVTNTWTLAYAAASTIVDIPGNEAQSRSGVVPTLALNPSILNVDFMDTNNNGLINRVDITFNVRLSELGGGDLAGEFALSNGYAIVAASETDSGGAAIDAASDADKVVRLTVTEKTVVDTGVVPDLTYTDDGDALCLVSSGAVCTTNQLQTVNSSTVVETDKAAPVLTLSGGTANSVILYETGTANDIWESGESLQLVLSENVDPASVSTSWSVVGGTGATAFTDFMIETAVASGVGVADNTIPDTGTVSVSGNIITLIATSSASAALTAANAIFFNPNEVKDAAGNSAYPSLTANAVVLVVTPTTAPTVSKVVTADLTGNGVLDALGVYFNGLVKASTIVMGDFAAAKGSNFTIAGGEAATSTSPVTPDLTFSSVATASGADASVVWAKFGEANEDTGMHPQLKYVQGSLADLAGNKTATFNAYASDNTKFETVITNDAMDEANPVVVYKGLWDRNLNGKVDQLILVFSETMTATNLNSTGWAVAGHTVASTGAYSNNVDYQQYTFAVTNTVFKADVTELGTEASSMPGVSYAASGVYKDLQSRLLASVSAGGEKSNVNFAAAPVAGNDGKLLKATGPSVYIARVAGAKMFKRHVLSSTFDTFYPHLAPFWSNVMNVSDSELNSYSLSAWIRVAGDPKVWEVNDDGTKHWITCADDSVAGQDCANEWTSSGRDFDGVYTVNSAEANSYVTGVNVVMPDVAN